ncbi:unnamed protein product [Vicia faba]|uniref:Transmembrane protein n=1 Tax=Vicia faba TaxID=3906 RepID=A0AAV0YI03_VICFA|nr:unnamed protein product [Vicia faba]
MDTKLKHSLTFLTFILLVSFLSLWLLRYQKLGIAESITRQRWCHWRGKWSVQDIEGRRSVTWSWTQDYRRDEGFGPSSGGVGHRFIGGMKDSGPSSGGVGH